MEKLNLYFLLVISLFAISMASKVAIGGTHHQKLSHTKAFVVSQCKATLYPTLCIHCLSTFVNSTNQTPQQIAHIALRVSLAKALYARNYLIKMAKEFKQRKVSEYQATSDCLDQINDGIKQLKNAVNEVQNIKEKEDENDFVWRESNVETWTSSALTNALTCMDSFSGVSKVGKTRAIIKAKILNVVQLTSNALALFNRYAARHRASHATKP